MDSFLTMGRRPAGLTTRIFLDSGNPQETREIIALLGFLDGQTTNPTLVAKHPEVSERLKRAERFTKDEILSFYRHIAGEISAVIPNGSISIEIYADRETSAEEMLAQGYEMFSWIPNAHIKFPTTHAGLTAAKCAIKNGMLVNMTLCFSQEQAAAVYAATFGARKGDVFVSPFVGRLDDRGENGMDIIANIIRMYRAGDGHVEVLTASARNLNQLLYAIKLGSDAVTVSYKVLREWSEKGIPLPGDDFHYEASVLTPVIYKEINLSRDWRFYNIAHDLTDKGMSRFSDDWNAILS